MYVLLYIYLISHILIVLCNYTLVPSQVLLPRTTFYRCKKTGQFLNINVQFVLKIEPSLCVNWKLQDSQVLLFDKSNYTVLHKTKELEDSQEYDNYNEDELKGCSSSVVLTTVPLNFKDDTNNNFTRDLVEAFDENENRFQLKTSLEHMKDNTDVKTFVFAYDSNFRFHAVAEVVISKLDRLTVETAYRKVSKNQTFTLKLRGLDKVGNTFSSLEGLPFYLLFEGPRIFEVQEVNEGELYSEKRANVLSQVENFTLPEGTTLVTDMVMFKGVKVGRAVLKFGLFLDEYSKVLSEPVEFVVNDSVVLSHQNIYMLNNTSFQLKLQYPTSGHMYPNGKQELVNMLNYEWSTDADETKVTLSQQGLVQVHLLSNEKLAGNENVDDNSNQDKEYKCVVYVKDLRTNELLKSYVNVMRPYSLMLKYNSLQSVNNCLLNKGLVVSKNSELFSSEEGLNGYLEKLLELNYKEGEECYENPMKQKENVVYLFENNYYLFKFNLMTYNKNLFNTFDSNLLKFTTSEGTPDGKEQDENLLKLAVHKQNYYVYKAMKLGCSYYDLSYGTELSGSEGTEYNKETRYTTKGTLDTKEQEYDMRDYNNKLVHRYKLCVLEQVSLPRYECKNKLKLSNNYEYSVCEKPLVVSVGDVFRLRPKGGSGKYKYELDGCYNEGNEFVCTEKGSYQLKVVDVNNEENGLVLQLVSTTVSSSRFEYMGLDEVGKYNRNKQQTLTKDNKQEDDESQEVNVRVNKGLKVKLSLYGDLREYKPMFKSKFTKEDSELYSFNYSVGERSNLLATVNDLDRLEETHKYHKEQDEVEYNKEYKDNKEYKEDEYKVVDELKLLSYDKRVLELKDCKKDNKGALVVKFKTVSVNSTGVEVNTDMLMNMYNKEYGERHGDKVYLDKLEFKRLLVNVYKDPVLYVNEKYRLPVINLNSNTGDRMNKSDEKEDVNKDDRHKDTKEYSTREVLANVALGSKVELNYKYGLKGNKPNLRNKSNNNVLYVENLEDNGNMNNSIQQGYMVYCVNVGEEELLFELLDYSKVYKVTCNLPKYNKLYPLNKLSSELYELVQQQDSSHLGLQGLGGYSHSKKYTYMVNKNKTNRYVNLLYDNNNNLLLPSDLYQSSFYLYQVDTNTSQNQKDKSKYSEILLEKNNKEYVNVFEFNLETNKDGQQTLHKDNKLDKDDEYKVVGYYKYVGNSDYYSEKFNRLYKYKRFNQLVGNSLKNNNWEYKNKQYVTSNYVYLVPKYNHKLLLQTYEVEYNEYKDNKEYKEDYVTNAYVMYNKLFVYKLYVYGGSGRYTLTSNASDFKYTFSKLYSFPGHLSRVDKEKMIRNLEENDNMNDSTEYKSYGEDGNEVLPVSVNNRKEVVVNLFDYGNLEDTGRFLTFTTDNMNDLVLNIKDEGLLWQDTVHLRLHFRYPNKFELLLSPVNVNKKLDNDDMVVSVKEEKEEYLYLEDKYRVNVKGYYNGNRLMNNSLLLMFKLKNSNLGLKSTSESKVDFHNLHLEEDHGYGEYGYDNGSDRHNDTKEYKEEDEYNKLQLFFKGGDELVLNTFGLGSSGLVVSDLDGNLQRTYRFKVINKLLLNYNNVTVLPDTHFDVTFKNLSNYNNLEVNTSLSSSSSTTEGTDRDRKVEEHKREQKRDSYEHNKDDNYNKFVSNYSLGFKGMGLYKYDVNVMYNNNQLTKLNQKLVVNVSKPTRMGFYLSSLDSTHSKVYGFSDNENMNNRQQQTLHKDSKVDKEEYVMVSDDNLFEYVVDRDAVVNLNVTLFDQDNNMFTPLYLNNNNLEFEYKLSESCGLVGHGGDRNKDNKKYSTNKQDKNTKGEEYMDDNSSQQGFRNEVVVSNKYNVLLSVNNNCEVVVTSRYNGVSLQSKKLKFKVKMKERLFSDLGRNASTEGTEYNTKDERDSTRYEEEYIYDTKNDYYMDHYGYDYNRSREYLQCRDDDENLCLGGVYKVKRTFRTYPENKLKEVGNNLYKVSSLGNVILTTDNNVYNVKLMKPTHFSLIQLNNDKYENLGSLGLYYYNNNYSNSTPYSNYSAGYQYQKQVDFLSYNMNKLMFKVVLFSNHRRLKTPRNAKFSVRMKDLSVFSYELEGDVLTLTPHKVGQTVVELVYSLSSTEGTEYNTKDERDSTRDLKDNKEYSRDEKLEGLKLLYTDDHSLNRVYFVRSGRYELTNVYNVMLGSQVYLTGSKVNGVVVNLDVNSYEFQKFLKNKYTVKSYGTNCIGFECGVSYVNKNEYVNDVNKLKHLVNLNRTSYKVLLNVVTNALNTVFSYSVDQGYGEYGYDNGSDRDKDTKEYRYGQQQNLYERKKLFNMSNLKEKYLCRNNYCWLQLNYTLKNTVSVNQVNQANQMLYNYYDNNYEYGNNTDNEDVEEVLKMLSSPLLGVDSTMWNSDEGVIKNVKVNSDRLGTYKFKNVNNEQVVTNVVRFDSTHYKFRQVDPSTILLLPNYPNTNDKQVTREQLSREFDLGVFGNHGNILYYNYGLNYQFKDSQLNKLYFLKLTYTPYVVHDSDERNKEKNTGKHKKGDSSNKDNKVDKQKRKEQEKVDKDSKKYSTNKQEEYDMKEKQNVYERKTGKLVYRLGYKLLLVNKDNKEWSVLKNYLRTMSADLLKGKHKLDLQLYYRDNKEYKEDKNTKGEERDEDRKEHRKEVLEQELEVELPESVVFVNSEGHLVNELNESSMKHVLHVYPVSSSHKLHLTSNNYVVKVVERSGQLATFIVYSNENGDRDTTPVDNNKLLFNFNRSSEGTEYNKESRYTNKGTLDSKEQDKEYNKFVGNNYLMVLNSSNHVVGRIKITTDLSSSTFSLSRFNFFSNKSLSDVLLLALTLVVLVFFFFVYNTLRNHHYYQPTVPIKLERTLPKAFDHLQQTRYHYRYHPH